jgi:hypothetical protein
MQRGEVVFAHRSRHRTPISGSIKVRVLTRPAAAANAAAHTSIKGPWMPGVNYVGGLRQLRRRVPAPHPLPWQGVGRRQAWPLLAGN